MQAAEGGSGFEPTETDGARGELDHSPVPQPVAVVTPQPAWTASSQAEGALRGFKQRHREAYAEAEKLMKRNLWGDAERLLQGLVQDGTALMEHSEARQSPSNRRQLGEKLVE